MKTEEDNVRKTYFLFYLERGTPTGDYVCANLYQPIKNNFPNMKFVNLENCDTTNIKKFNDELIIFFKKHPNTNIILDISGVMEKIIPEILYKNSIKNNIDLYAYLWDTEYYIDTYHRYLGYFLAGYALEDKFFIKKYHLYENPLINVYHMLFSCNFNFFKYEKSEKKYDVVFIGRPFGRRKKTIEHLIDNGVNVTVFGKGWGKYKKIMPYYGGFLTQEDLIKVLNQSKIILNISTTTYNDEWQIKGRLFEWLGCKIFQITNHDPRLSEFFEIGKEIVTYNNLDELVEKINYYLEHNEERDEISENAYRLAKEKYDYDKNLKGFSKFINKTSYGKLKNVQTRYPCSIIFHNINGKEFFKVVEKLPSDYDYYHFSDEIYSYNKKSKIDRQKFLEMIATNIVLISGNVFVTSKCLDTFIDVQVFNAKNNLPKVSFWSYYLNKELIIAGNLFEKSINLNFAFFTKDEFLSEHNTIKDKVHRKNFIYTVPLEFTKTRFPLIRIKNLDDYFGNNIMGKISKYNFLNSEYHDKKPIINLCEKALWKIIRIIVQKKQW